MKKPFRVSFQILLTTAIFATFLTFSCRNTEIEIAKHTKKITEPKAVPTAYLEPDMKIYQASDGTEISQSELIKDIEEPNETTYSVREGETCNTIAEKIGTTVNLILQSNPQLNNDCTNLKEGDILAIPAPQQSEPTVTIRDENIEHLVQEGETCGQIAKMYTVTLTELLTTNGLTEEDCQKMQIGVVLSIP